MEYICEEKAMDMHIHSRFSDGKLDMNEILERAVNGIRVISITDHDTMRGYFHLNKKKDEKLFVGQSYLVCIKGIEYIF